MEKVSADIQAAKGMTLLSQREIDAITQADAQLMHLFRRCALAVLNTGNEDDDQAALMNRFKDFTVEIVPQSRGIALRLSNAPASAFVAGKIVEGIREHLFAVLRDVVFANQQMNNRNYDVASSTGITDAVFEILRNANVVRPGVEPNLVVCWGGHSIGRTEYLYTKEVGYELGLRKLDIVTGCGPGAMKGPMKGAVIGHGKQHHRIGRYVGVSEPGIIGSESPNPTVNELVILPDIEKRLEAFVRLAHAIIVFPGGAGTAEEVLYLLGIKMAEKNQGLPVPLIFAAPEESAGYFEQLDQFLVESLGEQVRELYHIVVGNAGEVADYVTEALAGVKQHRVDTKESFAYNWQLSIPEEMQYPFEPSHDNMAGLNLHLDQSAADLAVHLRRAFSGIVAGNVKAPSVAAVKEKGPYQLHCDANIGVALDKLLQAFVEQGRMKISGEYTPCFTVV